MANNFANLSNPQFLSVFDSVLGSTSSATQGAGAIGYNPQLGYAAGTVGAAINAVLVSVKTFGAKGDGSTDDTIAIQAANTFASVNNGIVYFPNPAVAYVYSPAAAINIVVGWRGDSQYATIINVANAYAGEVFRVLPGAALENMTIQTPGLTKTSGSIGVRVSATAISAVCVNSELRRVYVRGFDKNIDLQNTYLLHGDHVHAESGNYGVNCTPDATSFGYITTHTWINGDFGLNGINVNYNTTNYSNTVTFVGGNISGATGAQQSFFNKVRVLKFIQTYFESASTLRAVTLSDCDYVSFDGGYLNGTGGIQMGSGVSTRIRISDMWATSSTDVLTGADGNQFLSLYDSNLPGAGTGSSALSLWKTLTLQNSNYNGTFYGYLARGQSMGFLDNFQSGGGSKTLDINGGNCQRVTVTDASAFTMAAPLNPTPGQPLFLTFQNSSGGALGAITFNAVFHLQGGAWTSPNNNFRRSMVLVFDGNVWIEISRSAADVPN